MSSRFLAGARRNYLRRAGFKSVPKAPIDLILPLLGELLAGLWLPSQEFGEQRSDGKRGQEIRELHPAYFKDHQGQGTGDKTDGDHNGMSSCGRGQNAFAQGMTGGGDPGKNQKNGSCGQRGRPIEQFYEGGRGEGVHDAFDGEELNVTAQSVGDRAQDAERRGGKQDGSGQKTVDGFARWIFLRGGDEGAGVASEAVGQGLQAEQAAHPKSDDHGDDDDEKLF